MRIFFCKGEMILKRIVVYDNEPAPCSELAAMLREMRRNAIVFEANTFETAKKLAEDGCYACFLDIELENGLNGIELAKEFRDQYPNTSLVFVTAHMRYCEQVFEASPDAMLVKPVSRQSLERALSLIEKKHSDSGVISISTGINSAQTLNADEICYAESLLRKVTVYGTDLKVLAVFRGIKLSELHERLPKQFVRCHQSFIVNLGCVSGISRYSFTLRNGQSIPISQSRFKDMRRRYIEFVGDAL